MKSDGNVVTWGKAHKGGNSNKIYPAKTDGELKDVKEICSDPDSGVCIALLKDGSVVAWGAGSGWTESNPESNPEGWDDSNGQGQNQGGRLAIANKASGKWEYEQEEEIREQLSSGVIKIVNGGEYFT